VRGWPIGAFTWADAKRNCETYMYRMIDVYVMLYDYAIKIYRAQHAASITRPVHPSPLAAANQYRTSHSKKGKGRTILAKSSSSSSSSAALSSAKAASVGGWPEP